MQLMDFMITLSLSTLTRNKERLLITSTVTFGNPSKQGEGSLKLKKVTKFHVIKFQVEKGDFFDPSFGFTLGPSYALTVAVLKVSTISIILSSFLSRVE